MNQPRLVSGESRRVRTQVMNHGIFRTLGVLVDAVLISARAGLSRVEFCMAVGGEKDI